MYFDIVQYSKAIGYVKEYGKFRVESNSDEDFNPYDFNFSKVGSYQVTEPSSTIGFNVTFKNQDNANRNFSYLLESCNYFGVFGHDFANLDSLKRIKVIGRNEDDSQNTQVFSDIVGGIESYGSGFTLIGIDDFTSTGNLESIGLEMIAGEQGFDDEIFDLGTISIGRYVDFANSADLSVNLGYSYEGISETTTISGRTIQNVNYYKSPDWGNYPKWQHIPEGSTGDYDVKQVNQGGRRQWSLKWSFIDKANALPKMTDGNMFAEDIIDSYPDSLSNGTMSDSIIGTMAQLSMGFNLPFIFQPDNTEQSFALVKANQKSISLKQVASGTYDISLKLTEVW
tara:strand:+ start:149 stop:1168 length:1020 start_codon:yes stop_codon:yes gene_type:complete